MLLERPPHPHHAAAAEAAPPEAQLAQLASSIQATNASVRQVEALFSSADRAIQGLQAGAAERDQVQDQVADMLLRYADELEAREREQAAAMAAWEREQARVKAEAAAREAEARRQARAEADRRAEQERRARLAAAEAARWVVRCGLGWVGVSCCGLRALPAVMGTLLLQTRKHTTHTHTPTLLLRCIPVACSPPIQARGRGGARRGRGGARC